MKKERLKRLEELNKLIDRYKDTVNFKHKNILWEAVSFIQQLLEFSFQIEGKEIPKLYFGEDLSEKQSTPSEEVVPQGQIFIKLNKRHYHTQTNRNDTKIFQNEGVVLAGRPNFHKTVPIEEREKEDVVKQGIYWSDNEFIFTVKTNTQKKQFEILNTLERTFNVYAPKIQKEFITVAGVVDIKTKEKKDKDDLETLEITYHMRLKEQIDINDYYIIEAIKIAFGIENDNIIKEDVHKIIDKCTELDKKQFVKELKVFPKKKEEILTFEEDI